MSFSAGNTVFAGIGTFTVALQNAGSHVVQGQCQVPSLVQSGQASTLVVTVNKNGSPIYTGTAGAQGFRVNLNAAVGDTVAVVTSTSSSTIDNPNNYAAVRTEIQIYQGV